MVPQLERVAHPLGAVVMSGGGFDSLTDKYNFAAQLDDRPTDVFDLGDHDPSGAHKCIAYQEDIEAFACRPRRPRIATAALSTARRVRPRR